MSMSYSITIADVVIIIFIVMTVIVVVVGTNEAKHANLAARSSRQHSSKMPPRVDVRHHQSTFPPQKVRKYSPSCRCRRCSSLKSEDHPTFPSRQCAELQRFSIDHFVRTESPLSSLGCRDLLLVEDEACESLPSSSGLLTPSPFTSLSEGGPSPFPSSVT